MAQDMSPSQFVAWIDAMKARYRIRSNAELARALGIGPHTFSRYLHGGADKRTALACRALYHNLEPWK